MCGILAVSDAKNDTLTEIARFGLMTLNHRGQESAGMASFFKEELHYFRDMGLVREIFSTKSKTAKTRTLRIYNDLKGKQIIGHVRYSTKGASDFINAQPLVFRFHGKEFAVAHNGQLTNKDELVEKCRESGYIFRGDSDTEAIGALISKSAKTDFLEALIDSLWKIKGTFVLAILFKENIYVVRDNFGVRPISLGKTENGFIAASESCVFECLGADFLRDVAPGEIVIINHDKLESIYWNKDINLKFCIFELIYFSRPSSMFFNGALLAASYRKKLGEFLAKEYPINADIVVPVMDSGLYGAQGYSQTSGIALEFALERNKYVGRTFIKPDSQRRKKIQNLKHTVISELVVGKKAVIVDDSLVRGDTSCERNIRLKKSGIKEIHECLTCPPIKFPCYYGIDMKTKDELAAGHLTVEEIRKKVGADSLNYLSYESMIKATGISEENFCTACFTGKYPIPCE